MFIAASPTSKTKPDTQHIFGEWVYKWGKKITGKNYTNLYMIIYNDNKCRNEEIQGAMGMRIQETSSRWEWGSWETLRKNTYRLSHEEWAGVGESRAGTGKLKDLVVGSWGNVQSDGFCVSVNCRKNRSAEDGGVEGRLEVWREGWRCGVWGM